MKCQYCGSPLSIEQEKCRFCGQPNPNFKQHREDMKQYAADFQKTRSHVYRETKKFTHTAVPLTVIVVLVLANILACFLISRSWELSSWLRCKDIEQNVDQHCAQLEQMLSHEDYLGFHRYFNNEELYLSDTFNCYQTLDNASSSYESIFRWLMNYRCSQYYTREETAEYVADSLQYLYESEEKFGAYEFRYDNPLHLPMIQDMIDRSHLLISSTLDIPLETVEGFRDLSIAKRQELMTGGAADE